MHTDVSVVEAPPGRGSTYSALRHRDFRLYFCAMLGSVFGVTTEFATTGWLVLQLTNSPLSLGIVGTCYAVPNVALTFVGGAVADRFDRRRILVATQACYALMYFTLGALVFAGLVQPLHAYLLALGSGSVRAFDSPIRQAILPYIVEKEDVASGVALINVVWQLPRLVGPAVAGVMIAGFGVGPTYYVAGTGMVCAAILFGLLRITRMVVEAGDSSLFRTVVDGLAFIRRHQLFYALIGMTFFNSVFGMSYVILLPVFARDILGVGSQGFGLLQTASALGGVLGILLTGWLAARGRNGWITIWCAGLFGVLLVAFALSPWYPLSLGIIFFAGATCQIYMTVINTVLLVVVPEAYRGRVMGVYGMAWSLIPLGGAIAGPSAELWGAPLAVVLGGSLVTAMAAVVAMAMPRVRELE